MKLENYLPKIAEEFPGLYIEGIEPIIQKLKEKIKVSEVVKTLNIKENTLRDVLNNVSRCSLGLLKRLMEFVGEDLWEEVYQQATFLGGKTFTNRIKIPKKLTSELAYFAGALRDGGLSTYKSELVISQLSKRWLEKRIQPVLKKVFSVKCKISGPRKKDNCYYIKFRSVALFALIKILLNWEKGKWKTPKIILKAPLELQKEYIKGFWEAEGSNLAKGGISLSQAWITKNECPPLSDLVNMLQGFGIESWIRKPQIRKSLKPLFTLYIPKRYKETFFQTFQPDKMK